MDLIPTKEAFEIFSFGLFSIQDTAAGIKASMSDSVDAKVAAGADNKIEMKKFDPVVRKHVIYKEAKIR